MDLETSRFGRVQYDQEDVIEFPEGILGFGHIKKYIMVEDPHDEVFIWLQSCDSSDVAFPILEPELFSSSYSVELNRHELEAIQIKTVGEARIFNIVTIPENPTQMTANLKAPIVVNVKNRIARQCVLQDNDLAIREPIFKDLQQRIYSGASTDQGPKKRDCEVFVRLTDNV